MYRGIRDHHPSAFPKLLVPLDPRVRAVGRGVQVRSGSVKVMSDTFYQCVFGEICALATYSERLEAWPMARTTRAMEEYIDGASTDTLRDGSVHICYK